MRSTENISDLVVAASLACSLSYETRIEKLDHEDIGVVNARVPVIIFRPGYSQSAEERLIPMYDLDEMLEQDWNSFGINFLKLKQSPKNQKLTRSLCWDRETITDKRNQRA